MVLADDLPVLSAKTLEVAVDISKANQDANRLTVDLGYIKKQSLQRPNPLPPPSPPVNIKITYC